jgi:Sap, sulfolipid-1-addressing protein
MWSAVLVLSLIAAIDPVRIGIVVLLISRPRPMVSLLAFWLGGMAAGTAAALILVLYLRDLTLSVMRVLFSAVSSPVAVHVRVAIGVLAVLIAGLIAARFRVRQHASVRVTGEERSVLVLDPNTRTGSSRLSIRRQLEGGSLAVAFIAGVGWATPPVEYLAAIITILASGTAAAVQVSAAFMFTLVAFTVAEIPLMSYLATPAKTVAVVLRLHDWIESRRQAILAVFVCTFGVILVVGGIGHVRWVTN